MSLSLSLLPLPVPLQQQQEQVVLHRKRTSSFSYPQSLPSDPPLFPPSPRPAKSPRVSAPSPMGSPLRRSETMISIPSMTHKSAGAATEAASTASTATAAAAATAATAIATATTCATAPLKDNDKDAACYRVLQRHREDRLRRKALVRTHSEYIDFTTSRPRLEVTPPRAAGSTSAAPQPQPQPRPLHSGAASASSSSRPRTSTLTTPSRSAAPFPTSTSTPPTPKPVPVLHPKPRKPSPIITTPTPSSPSSTTPFTPVYTKKRTPPSTPPQITLPSPSSPIPILRTQRTSSPLSPAPPRMLPGRPVFPRSKPEPDLYRTAIKMRMRGSPEGLRVLHMGPRLAMSIMNATRELEKIVADQTVERDRDNDVVMGDATATPQTTSQTPAGLVGTGSIAMPVLTASWVVVKGEDWEMVDCAA